LFHCGLLKLDVVKVKIHAVIFRLMRLCNNVGGCQRFWGI